jgi:hypothetical protein
MESASQLTHLANVEDDATSEAFELFTYTKVGGRRARLMVEREIADDAKEVRRRLRKFNAPLSPDVTKSTLEVERAIKTEPLRLLRLSAATGWIADDSAFVTSFRTIDSKPRRRKILPPRQFSGAPRRGMKPDGDIEGWKRSVALPCGFSDLRIVVLSMAFAAPLLKMVGPHSFGNDISGLSKTGKSTILVAGSSVGGVGREEELPNWAATSASTGEFCRLYCDTLMPINEVGLIKRKEAYGKIQPTIYQIAEGRERDRHSKSTFPTNDRSAYCRIIFCSTAEHSFDDYAKLASEERDEGELARCMEIPAVRNDRPTAIDRFPAFVPPDQRKAWARLTLKRLRKACELHHGVALPPFVRFVMSDRRRAKSRVDTYMEGFMEGIDTAGMSGGAEHAAENCALIYAGGCMAIDADLLPYRKQDVMRAVTRCFRDVLRSTRDNDPLVAAKRLLRRHLRSDAIFNQRRPDDQFDGQGYDGYVTVQGGRPQYVVRASSLREWFKTEPGAFRRIIDWLKKKRCLLPRAARETQINDRPTDWAERITKWPDGKSTSVRSIIFYDPFA